MTAALPTPGCPARTLVTGASGRVGARIARLLHERGHRIALHYRGDAPGAIALADEMNALRANSACCLPAELADPDQRRGLFDGACEALGGIDNLVNNASSFCRSPLATLSSRDLQDALAVNLLAPFDLTLALARHLDGRPGGVVNILDIYATTPLPGHAAYSVSKAGLWMATKALALELGPTIRVNAVSPGTVLWSDNPKKAETLAAMRERTALGRVGTPQDVAAAVAFLLDEAAYCSGTVIEVDGGRNLFR